MMKKYLLFFMVFFWAHAHAVEFTVTTTEDTIDVNLADGLCADIHGECSLRAAIMQSNIWATDDVIILPRGVSYGLSLDSEIDTQEVNDLDIWDSLTLTIENPELPILTLDEMPWIAINIDGDVDDRVFEIHAGELITFKGIVIAYGNAANSLSNSRKGGGVYVADQVETFRISDSIVALNQAGFGAGIYSLATNTWVDTTDISYNILTSPSPPLFPVAGAAVYHGGMEMTVNKSSIHNNILEHIGFFSSAIYVEGDDSQVNFLNTLIADNGVWPSVSSGVINGVRVNQADTRFNNSNITGNSGVGIQFNSDDAHTLTIRNTVLAFNVLGNCDEFTGVQDFGEALNPAHIISSDTSCSLPEFSRNLEDVDPMLSPIEGRFEVIGFEFFSIQFPETGSVLIDAGSTIEPGSVNVSACEATDIRGVLRPIQGGLFNFCDVGIYESGDLIFKTGFELID